MKVKLYMQLEKAGIRGIDAMRFQLENIEFFMRNNIRNIRKLRVE